VALEVWDAPRIAGGRPAALRIIKGGFWAAAPLFLEKRGAMEASMRTAQPAAVKDQEPTSPWTCISSWTSIGVDDRERVQANREAHSAVGM